MVHYFMQKNLLFHASKVQVQTEYIYFEWVSKKWTQKLTQISQDTYFVVICVYIKFRSENPMRNVYSASLWNFFGDPPVCKQRTLQFVRNIVKLFHTLPILYQDISTSSMIFRHCLLFFTFSECPSTGLRSSFVIKIYQIWSSLPDMPQFWFNNMNITFPFNYFEISTHMQLYLIWTDNFSQTK